MTLPFGKFFWSDYASDPALKICSFAAQGLWMRMLCIAAEHDPVGYVAINGRGLDSTMLARVTGGSVEEIETLLSELAENGVYSRDRRGWIYSRRMVRDAKKARNARENGKKGGNPSLCKQSDNSAQDNLDDKGQDKPHIPEARNQKKNPSDKKIGIPDDWEPEPFAEGSRCRAITDGWNTDEWAHHTESFKAYHEREQSRFSDWQAAWKTWVLNSVKFSAPKPKPAESTGYVYVKPRLGKRDAFLPS